MVNSLCEVEKDVLGVVWYKKVEEEVFELYFLICHRVVGVRAVVMIIQYFLHVDCAIEELTASKGVLV